MDTIYLYQTKDERYHLACILQDIYNFEKDGEKAQEVCKKIDKNIVSRFKRPRSEAFLLVTQSKLFEKYDNYGVLDISMNVLEEMQYNCFDYLYWRLREGTASERWWASRLLGMIPPLKFAPAIQEIVTRFDQEEDMKVLSEMIFTLRRLEAVDKVSTLESMLDDDKYAEIKEAIEDAINYLSE